MKFSVKGFVSKYEQCHSFLSICSHLLKKPLTASFFCWEVLVLQFFLAKYFSAIYSFSYFSEIILTAFSDNFHLQCSEEQNVKI